MINIEMVNEMAETFVAKRNLGNGRWDKVLKRRLTELSVADNYEEAKDEWIATGQVWWGNADAAPDWVTNSQMGRGKCLCGHVVVYHFEIVNTENGVVECVGSDHINTYLIMKSIAEDKGIPIDTITDAEIQEWINVRVASMKSTAWWAENGATFTLMFNKVKEIDLHYNVHTTPKQYYDNECEKYRYITKIRKASKGEFATAGFKMASIVWRWNHPDNPKNQQTTRGYPNDMLMRDLSFMFVKSKEMIHRYETYKANIEAEKALVIARREARKERQRLRDEERRLREEERKLQWEAERPAREARERANRLRLQKEAEERKARAEEANRIQAIENARFLLEHNDTFENMCGYYGMPVFDASWAKTHWETNFLADIKLKLSREETLSNSQLTSLRKILVSDKASEKQIQYLMDLGYEGSVEDLQDLTKKQASIAISKLKGEKDE